MKYVVEVRETLKKEVQVFAESEQEARKAVIDEYMSGDLVLNADDYCGVTEFTVTETSPSTKTSRVISTQVRKA